MKYIKNIMFIGFNQKTDSHFRELYEQVNRKEKFKKKNREMEKVLSSFNQKCQKEKLTDINIFSEDND